MSLCNLLPMSLCHTTLDGVGAGGEGFEGGGLFRGSGFSPHSRGAAAKGPGTTRVHVGILSGGCLLERALGP